MRPAFCGELTPEALTSRCRLEILLETVVGVDGEVIRIDGEYGSDNGKMDRFVVRPDKDLHVGPE